MLGQGGRSADAARRPGRRSQAGTSIVEVVAVTAVVGIAVLGVALMFGKGGAWVSAVGADRVAAGLAQERIEQIRAAGWNSEDALPGKKLPEHVRPSRIVGAGSGVFRRLTCIQHVNRVQQVDESTPTDLTVPPADDDCADGPPSDTRRITVTVYPVGGDGLQGSPQTPDSTPVVLQAWITSSGQ